MSWETLSGLVNRNVRRTYGEAVTYTPASTGIPESISCPFDAAVEVVEMQGDVPVVGVAPVIDVVLSDLTVRPRGRPVGSADRDLVTVRAQAYSVLRVEPGGHGTVRCVLTAI
jgi:hypothetical protein